MTNNLTLQKSQAGKRWKKKSLFEEIIGARNQIGGTQSGKETVCNQYRLLVLGVQIWMHKRMSLQEQIQGITGIKVTSVKKMTHLLKNCQY